MTYQEAATAYSKGLICFEELIAMRGEFVDEDKEVSIEPQTCDHTCEREKVDGQIWCVDCGALVDGGPGGDGEDD